ncbi:MAG TPA: hypothetical protein VLM79_03850 [Kofleriaceae bacterium]|nr:hypothetical protein [Kofleriaceae bacterium]
MSSSLRASFGFLVACFLVASGALVVAACGSPAEPAPDAAPPSTIPTSPAGTFAITSQLDIHVPAAAAPLVAMLTAATDGPDDPARFLVDRMIATLPEGSVKSLAERLSPYVAAYLSARLVELAPRLAPGLDAMAVGLVRIATHLGTVETLRIDAGGAATRTISGARFELGGSAVTVRFADAGLPDVIAPLHVALDETGHLRLSEHAHPLPYGALLQLGLDRAVAVSVEPTARDLAGALSALVDCERLGALVADRVGLGSAALYTAACRAAMTAVASEVGDRIAAIDDGGLGLDVSGTATGLDADGDGTMDELRGGSWSGSLYSDAARDPIAAASFAGGKAP